MQHPPASTWSAAPVFAALLLLVGTTALFLVLRRGPSEPAGGGTPGFRAVVEVIGRSVEGRPMVCYQYGKGPRALLVKASIHGTEGAGTPLTLRLMEWLDAHPEAWENARIFVLPISNPDGLEAHKRFNAKGIDLNRNFPAENREDTARFGQAALSEPESRALHDFILRIQPDVIVAIHQPLVCVDYDGPAPAEALAKRMAASTGLPLNKLGARPGSLGAWFGETLRRPILTLELPRTLTDDPDRLWSKYGPALRELVENPESWVLPLTGATGATGANGATGAAGALGGSGN